MLQTWPLPTATEAQPSHTATCECNASLAAFTATAGDAACFLAARRARLRAYVSWAGMTGQIQEQKIKREARRARLCAHTHVLVIDDGPRVRTRKWDTTHTAHAGLTWNMAFHARTTWAQPQRRPRLEHGLAHAPHRHNHSAGPTWNMALHGTRAPIFMHARNAPLSLRWSE